MAEIGASVRETIPAVVAMALVGGSVGVSNALVDAPLFTAQAIRYAIAAVLLAGVAHRSHQPIVRPRGSEWLWLAGIAACGLVLFNVAIVRGVAHAEPAVIAVAVACVPIVLGIAGPLMARQTPSRRIALAALVVTAGAVLVEGGGSTDAAGVLWAVLTLACEAAFTLLALPVLPRHTAWGVSVHSVWLGALMLTVLSLAVEGPRAAASLTSTDLAAIGYLAALVTAAAFVLWYTAVARLGPARTGLLTGIAPISAALTGIAVVGHVPGPAVWFGIAVVGAGLAVGLRTGQARAVPPANPAANAMAAAATAAGSRLSE